VGEETETHTDMIYKPAFIFGKGAKTINCNRKLTYKFRSEYYFLNMGDV
jgi:hypothetical protein